MTCNISDMIHMQTLKIMTTHMSDTKQEQEMKKFGFYTLLYLQPRALQYLWEQSDRFHSGKMK